MDQYPIKTLSQEEIFTAFPALKFCYRPPKKLWYRGNLPHHTIIPVAVVGSRRPTRYGIEATRKLITEIRNTNLGIVSGLAYGIDIAAHEACLVQQVPIIAFPGSGLSPEVIYPEAHRAVALQILQSGGCLISEYPPNERARPYFFPERNRLMAAIAQVTIVIEGGAKSGTLITARLALEGGKEVGAVPGPITSPLSKVPNELIQEGAHPILSGEDLITLTGASPRTHPCRPHSSANSLEDQDDLDHLLSQLNLQ